MISSLFRVFSLFVIIAALATPAYAAKWGKLKKGDCDMLIKKREYTARLWRKPFDPSGKKICKTLKNTVSGSKRLPAKCEKGWHQGYVGYWNVTDKTCGSMGPELQVLPPDYGQKKAVANYQKAAAAFGGALTANDGALRKSLEAALKAEDLGTASSLLSGNQEFLSYRDSAAERGHRSVIVGLAGDASVIVGIGVDLFGVAADTGYGLLTGVKHPDKLYAAGSGTIGWSIAAGGNIVWGSFEAHNYCLAGKAYGFTQAGAVVIDFSRTFWFEDKDDRNDLDEDLAYGQTFGLGLGIGIEAIEFSTSTTKQKQTDAEKTFCENQAERRREARESQ